MEWWCNTRKSSAITITFHYNEIQTQKERHLRSLVTLRCVFGLLTKCTPLSEWQLISLISERPWKLQHDSSQEHNCPKLDLTFYFLNAHLPGITAISLNFRKAELLWKKYSLWNSHHVTTFRLLSSNHCLPFCHCSVLCALCNCSTTVAKRNRINPAWNCRWQNC